MPQSLAELQGSVHLQPSYNRQTAVTMSEKKTFWSGSSYPQNDKKYQKKGRRHGSKIGNEIK